MGGSFRPAPGSTDAHGCPMVAGDPHRGWYRRRGRAALDRALGSPRWIEIQEAMMADGILSRQRSGGRSERKDACCAGAAPRARCPDYSLRRHMPSDDPRPGSREANVDGMGGGVAGTLATPIETAGGIVGGPIPGRIAGRVGSVLRLEEKVGAVLDGIDPFD